MGKLLANGINVANLLGIIAQVAGIFPENKYAILIQTIIAALMPSLGGAGHSIFFGTKQDAVPAGPTTVTKLP